MKKMSSENILNVSRLTVLGCIIGIIAIPLKPLPLCIAVVTTLTLFGVGVGFKGKSLADKRRKEEDNK